MTETTSTPADIRAAKLHEANLSIFVKKYEHAKKRLLDLSNTFNDMTDYEIQMRRIELYARSGELGDLRTHFDEMHFREILSEQDYDQLVLMTDQYSEKFVQDEIIAKTLTLFEQYGPHAVLHYVLGFAYELKGEWHHALENYLECQKMSENWNPVRFGLSQVYYQLGDANLGDQYFFDYEQACPFNVYGNFQTHKSVFKTYFDQGQVDEARLSVELLEEWWVEHKQTIPAEVEVLKTLAFHQVNLRKDGSKLKELEGNLRDDLMIQLSLENEPRILVFCGQTLDEFDRTLEADKFFKKALEMDESQDSAHQTLSYWLKKGEESRALKIYGRLSPYKRALPSIAFCELVVSLRLSGNDVESYIMARDGAEKSAAQAQTQPEWMEILSTLKALEMQYQNDPHLYRLMSKAYLALESTEAAHIAIARMSEIDPYSVKSQQAALEHAMVSHNAPVALQIIQKLEKNVLGDDEKHHLNLLKFDAYYDAKNFNGARMSLEKTALRSPWNIEILIRVIVAEVLSDAKLDYIEYSTLKDVYLRSRKGDSNLHIPEKTWRNMITSSKENRNYELAYGLAKIMLLTSGKDRFDVNQFFEIGLMLHPQRLIQELSYLLNTRWDCLGVYLCIAKLYGEIDQSPTAASWLELGLARSSQKDPYRAECEILHLDLQVDIKSDPDSEISELELLKDRHEIEDKTEIYLALLKGYIKTGHLKSAGHLIDSIRDVELNATQLFKKDYYYGLLLLRSGRKEEANVIWKPLIKSQQSELVVQKMKKKLMEHYYEHSELSALKH